MNWREACVALWGGGDDKQPGEAGWHRALAETVHVHPRKAQRWASGKEKIPPQVERWLLDTVERVQGERIRRVYGGVIRFASRWELVPHDLVAVIRLVERDIISRPPWGDG